jgi:hypothetical protein
MVAPKTTKAEMLNAVKCRRGNLFGLTDGTSEQFCETSGMWFLIFTTAPTRLGYTSSAGCVIDIVTMSRSCRPMARQEL